MTTDTKEKPAKRGAAAKQGTPPEAPLTLRYDLAELTSTQHRAGLAGLVLMVRWLERAPVEQRGVCRITELDERGATLEVDREGLAMLFDELYAATEEENAENAQRKDKKSGALVAPIRTEERTTRDDKGKEKKKTVYLYPVVVPRARLLVEYEPERNNQGLWVRLWRNMMWSILRGVPATREPFDARAERRPTKDADEAWRELSDPTDPETELPSTYYLGAMARTAENVGFADRARRMFLLHFWPYVAQVYVPQTLDVREGRYDFHGFAIAIPDVAELEAFCGDFERVMRSRTAEADRYRPKGAVVDLAVEAALDLSKRLREAVSAREGRNATRDLVLGFDVVHTNKEGNNVRVYSNTRITPDARLLGEYERVRGRFWDPLFRRQVLLNVVGVRPWFAGFDRLAETTPHKTQMIGRWQFCRDVVEMFRERRELMERRDEEPVGEKNLDVLVYEMVRNYVSRKAEAKSGTSWAKAKDNPGLKKAWEEQKERAAGEAFLAVRSRTESDFVDYFVGTLCSKGQYLRGGRFDTIACALRDPVKVRDVRTLTLLALSAESWVATGNNDKKSGE
jgi:CRISPR-associated protein Cmx8